MKALVQQTYGPLENLRLALLKELVEAGKLRPHVDRRYPLARAVDALKELEKGHARGKLLVVID